MDRRRIAASAAAVVLGVGGAAVALRGGGHGDKPATPALDPLTFMPADADATFDLDLRASLIAVVLGRLAPPGTHIPTHGRAALALRGSQRFLAFEDDRSDAGVVLAGPPSRSAKWTRAAFEKRVAGLAAPRAAARVAFNPRMVLARVDDGVAQTRWASTLREGAAAIVVKGNTVTLPFLIAGSGAALADLPIAPGRTAPRAGGRDRIVLAVRDPARTLRFLRETGRLRQLDALRRVPGFLKPDLAHLGESGTLLTDGRGRITVRLDPPDARDWARKLDRLDALSGLARALKLADVRIDRRGDAYRIEDHGRFALRVGVYGSTVVLSTGEHTDLAAVARASRRRSAANPGAGSIEIAPEVLLEALPFASPIRPSALTGWLRAEPATLTGELRLSVP